MYIDASGSSSQCYAVVEEKIVVSFVSQQEKKYGVSLFQ